MATKSIGPNIKGGKPPSRETSDRILRAKGKSNLGHSISSMGCKCSSNINGKDPHNQFEHETNGLFHLASGGGDQAHFIKCFAVCLARLSLHIHVDLDIRPMLLHDPENIRGVRRLEGKILGVLRVDNQGRHLILLGFGGFGFGIGHGCFHCSKMWRLASTISRRGQLFQSRNGRSFHQSAPRFQTAFGLVGVSVIPHR